MSIKYPSNHNYRGLDLAKLEKAWDSKAFEETRNKLTEAGLDLKTIQSADADQDRFVRKDGELESLIPARFFKIGEEQATRQKKQDGRLSLLSSLVQKPELERDKHAGEKLGGWFNSATEGVSDFSDMLGGVAHEMKKDWKESRRIKAARKYAEKHEDTAPLRSSVGLSELDPHKDIRRTFGDEVIKKVKGKNRWAVPTKGKDGKVTKKYANRCMIVVGPPREDEVSKTPSTHVAYLKGDDILALQKIDFDMPPFNGRRGSYDVSDTTVLKHPVSIETVSEIQGQVGFLDRVDGAKDGLHSKMDDMHDAVMNSKFAEGAERSVHNQMGIAAKHAATKAYNKHANGPDGLMATFRKDRTTAEEATEIILRTELDEDDPNFQLYYNNIKPHLLVLVTAGLI